MFRSTLFSLCLTTLALHCAAAGATTLAPVIVTATRTAQTQDQTLASVTVIDRNDIERQQARSVQDALRGIPGLDIANNGGPGKVTSLFLRGAESDQVLVLIDGVKVGSATAGLTAIQDLPMELIDRIEVVRGPRSSLYGSEAIGGVIQIFTRKGGGALKPYLSAGGGSHGSYEGAAGISGGGDRGWFNATASVSHTDGFNACSGTGPTAALPFGGGCFTNEPDDDKYGQRGLTARAGYRLADNLEVEGHLLQTRAKSQFDGTFSNQSKTRQRIFGGRVTYSPLEFWRLSVNGGRSRDISDSFLNGPFVSRFETERDSVSIQNDISLGESQLLSLGWDYLDDEVSGTTAYTISSRSDKGLFAQYQGSVSGNDLQLAVRRDNNEQFGHHTTGSVAWGRELGASLRLTASYGSAFKAPTFNELFFPLFGNPALDPEKSQSAEVGLHGRHGWGSWSLNGYSTWIDDLISFNAALILPSAPFGAPDNISKARIRGLEAQLDTQLAGWQLRGNLTLMDPENRDGGANHGNQLPRRAEQSARLDADRQLGGNWERVSLGATLRAAGKRYDDLANTRRLGGYATLDLRGAYRLTTAWRLQVRLSNLFDKDYETAEFFNQPDRSLFVTVRYQPQ